MQMKAYHGNEIIKLSTDEWLEKLQKKLKKLVFLQKITNLKSTIYKEKGTQDIMRKFYVIRIKKQQK